MCVNIEKDRDVAVKRRKTNGTDQKNNINNRKDRSEEG